MPVVQMEDGTELEFPDSMSREEMRSAILSKYPTDSGPSESEKAAASLADTRKLIRDTRLIQQEALARHPNLEAATLGLTEAMQEPVVSPETLTRWAAAISRNLPSGFGPTLGPSAPRSARRGAEELAGETLSSLTTPTTAGLIASAPLAPEVVLPYFGYQGYKDIPEAVAQVVEGETSAERVKGGGRAAMDALMLLGAGEGLRTPKALMRTPLTEGEIARLPSGLAKPLESLDVNPEQIRVPAAALTGQPGAVWKPRGVQPPTPAPNIPPVEGIDTGGVGPIEPLPPAKPIPDAGPIAETDAALEPKTKAATVKPMAAQSEPKNAGELVAGAARGIVDSLYDGIFKRLSEGKYPEIYKGQTGDEILAEHKLHPFTSPEEIKKWVNTGERTAEVEDLRAKVTAERPKNAGQGKLSQEFDKLIGEHGLQLGWITKPDQFFAEIGRESGDTASVTGKIAKHQALQIARKNAARDIGVNPSDMDTATGRAQALEALKQHIAEQSKADTLSEHSSHVVEFLPESRPALDLGKPETVEEQAARLAKEAQQKSEQDKVRIAQEKEATAKREMLERAKAPLGGDLGSAGQGALFPEPGQQEMFKALGGQLFAGIPNPIATYKSAVALTKAGIKALTPAAQRSAQAIRDVAHEVINAEKMTDYRRAVLNWSAKLQRSFGEASDAQRDIQKRVPDKVRREGITNWIQADGDAAKLTARMNATPDKKLKAGYEAALNLTPDEIAVANEVRGAYNALGLRGDYYDVLKSFKDNYVTQIWDLKKGPSGSNSSRTLKDKFRFARASSFPTFFDGEQAGYVPKTKDISQLLPVYLHEMNSVIAARQLVQELSKGKGTDGRPLVAPRGVGVPIADPGGKATLVMPKVPKPQRVGGKLKDTSDYRTMNNQPALNDWRWIAKDDAGNPIFLKADLALHPEAYNRIKAVLGRSAIREWYNTPTTAIAGIPKAIVKAFDLGQSETKRTMLGAGAPFHQVQEGTHAVGHRVNPFGNIPKIDLVNDAGQFDAAKHGLMLLPDRASEAQFMEGMRPSGLVSKIPVAGPLADAYSNYLFHQYIPGLKYKTYQAILERNQKVYASDIAAGKVKLEEVKALSATQTNAAYGHLNYADLGRDPTIQHLMQLALLAPDFLEARAKFAGQAIKGITGAKVGREQMIALATLAVAQATAAWIGAKTTGGEWDRKHPFEFRNGNRRFTMRSVPEDISNAIQNTRVFIHSRVSPIIGKGAIQYASGVDWRGQKVSGVETTKELLQQPIPLTLRASMQHLLGIQKPGDISVLEQLAGAAGLKVSRANPRQTLNDLHAKWLATNPDPKVKAEYERNQKATFPVSAYKTLDNAIADGNDKLALNAIAELQKTEKDQDIYKRFYKASQGPLFHESIKHENDFKKTLNADEQKLYEQARKYRAEQFKRFTALWARRERR